MRFAVLNRLALIVLVPTFVSCGGGGGGGGGGGTDTVAPTAAITFPPAPALTTSATVTVVGTASDAVGVTSVTVNGIAATSTNGFATWRATVPLVAGLNTLTVSASDAAANNNAAAASVAVTRTSTWVQRPTGIDYDPVSARVLVSDQAIDGILAVATDGVVTLVGGTNVGSGPDMDNPNEVAALDGAGYVADGLQGTITRIDLADGDRTLISGPATGSGTAIVGIIGLGADAVRDRILLTDFHLQGFPQQARLMVIDPVTGARSVLSSDTVGSGDAFGVITAVIHDTFADRYLVIEHNRLFAVDPTSGARTVLSSSTVGSGPNLSSARDIILLSANQALVAVAPSSANAREFDEVFIAVDLTTGDRTAVAYSGATTPPSLASGMIYVARDTATSDVHVVEHSGGKHYRLTLNSPTDIATIEELEPAAASLGNGPRLVLNDAIAYDPTGARFFLPERRPGQVTAVARANGARTVAASGAVGIGTAPVQPRRTDWDAAGGRVIVVDTSAASWVYAVAPSSGDRTDISSDAAIAALGTPNASAIDTARNSIVLGGFSSSALLRVDLVSGVATTVATLSATQPASSQITAIAFDAAGDRYVVGDEDGRVFVVAAATGVTVERVNTGIEEIASIVVESTTNALVTDWIDGEIHRVNLNTGARTLLASHSTIGTRGFGSRGDLVRDATTGLIYGMDNGTHAVTVLEPVSGDRVILSR